uniref:Noelin domain-containing protein n=1 Tax=Xiphophorus couchianus TaxID=32473 RepID=A0A3B5L4M5_9TELE
MEVVHLRTSRDLQYVRDSEPLLRGVDGHLHTYVASPRTLTSKTLQVLKRHTNMQVVKQTLHIKSQVLRHMQSKAVAAGNT